MVEETNLEEADIVIPYREEKSSEELRYTLRGIAQNLPHRNVVICGDLPDWCQNVIHIPSKSKGVSRFHDVDLKVMDACLDDRISEDFIFFNDDIFVLEPIQSLPDYFKASMAEDISERFKRHRSANIYVKGLRTTDQLLDKLGYKNNLSFEVHLPMLMNKAKRLEVSRLMEGKHKRAYPLFHRSIYGNMFSENRQQHEDVKVNKRDELPPVDAVFLSTLQTHFVDSMVGKHIMSRLKHKCKYEKS